MLSEGGGVQIGISPFRIFYEMPNPNILKKKQQALLINHHTSLFVFALFPWLRQYRILDEDDDDVAKMLVLMAPLALVLLSEARASTLSRLSGCQSVHGIPWGTGRSVRGWLSPLTC